MTSELVRRHFATGGDFGFLDAANEAAALTTHSRPGKCCNLLQYGHQCGYTGIVVEYERKRVKLGKTGGSPSVVLPKAWVDGMVGGSEVDLVRTEHRIVIEAPRQAPEPDFENEPAFGAFLGLLLQETITQPPLAKETADLLARSARLTAGVKLGHD